MNDSVNTEPVAAAAAIDPIEASFDILARQDQQAADITAIRNDVNAVAADET